MVQKMANLAYNAKFAIFPLSPTKNIAWPFFAFWTALKLSFPIGVQFFPPSLERSVPEVPVLISCLLER